MKSKLKPAGKWIIGLCIALLLSCCCYFLFRFKGDPSLTGSWRYGEKTVYTFNSNGTGEMKLQYDAYPFRYQLKEDEILIDYEDKTISDAVYKYQITENTLVLNGGEGTSGGVYELKKQ